MNNNNYQLIRGLLFTSVVVMGMTACTKVERDDDFKTGEAPPVPGGYVNSSEIAPTNLVAYWDFNGTLKDAVSGTTATNAGSTFGTGIKGQGYKGSSTAYANFTPAATLQGLKSFSISFWLNSPTNTGAIGIFTLTNTTDFWGSLDIYQDNGGSGNQAVFKVHLNNANVPWAGQFTDTKIETNKWVHICVTYDAATSKFNIYQNGTALGVNSAGNPGGTVGPVLHGSDPAASPVTPYGDLRFVGATAAAFGAFQFQTTPPLTGAASAQSWATNYAGSMDEFRIYNRALTAQEVSAIAVLEKQGR